MKTLPSNRNLHVYTSRHFNGLLLTQSEDTFIYEYLEKMHSTIITACNLYSRLFVIRVDLRYPRYYQLPTEAQSSAIIHRYFESLKSKIRHNQEASSKENKRVHHTGVIYVWVKECGQDGRPHYHLLVMLNNDAYFTAGSYQSEADNLAKRIESAWASALGIPNSESRGLANISGQFKLTSTAGGIEGLESLFCQASYICKARTKRFGNTERVFGSSRI